MYYLLRTLCSTVLLEDNISRLRYLYPPPQILERRAEKIHNQKEECLFACRTEGMDYEKDAELIQLVV